MLTLVKLTTNPEISVNFISKLIHAVNIQLLIYLIFEGVVEFFGEWATSKSFNLLEPHYIGTKWHHHFVQNYAQRVDIHLMIIVGCFHLRSFIPLRADSLRMCRRYALVRMRRLFSNFMLGDYTKISNFYVTI